MIFFPIMKKIWFNGCPSQFRSVVYRRYFDDISIQFKSKEHLKLFFNDMISKHENIKFTLTAEDQKRFSFLDVKISRKKKQSATSIFHKASFVWVFTNYDIFIFGNYRCIQNHVKHLWWSVLGKNLAAFRRCLISQNPSSWMFKNIFNWKAFSNVITTLLV